MLTVILVAHILVSIVLIAVVLMQRSEGGALGIGGGGGPGGGLMSGSGVTGALVRTTIIFGAIFFLTSLGLTTISTNRDSGGLTDIERALEEDFAPDPADDALGIGDLDDILAPDRSLIGNDPLAVDVAPVPADDTETPQDDPLGSAQ